MRNYEYGNILAIPYRTGNIPGERQLWADLDRMLALLAVLYGRPSAVPIQTQQELGEQNIGDARNTDASSQGPLKDAIVRRAVELWAEDSAVAYFAKLGWTVERVGAQRLGYDLESTNNLGQTLHVEVKGTRSRGEEVILTPNEVCHNQDRATCSADHVLYVLSEIHITDNVDPECTGGVPSCIWPWAIAAGSLKPNDYTYRVPKATTD
jgi:hypothetical protein